MKAEYIRRFFLSLLAVILVAAVCIVPSAQIVAKGLEEPEYISELKTFIAPDVASARKKAESVGYIPVQGDLNAGTGYDAVVLGYKTTTDVNHAITGVSMAQMKSGYRVVRYGDIAKKQAERLTGVASELMNAIREFAANYRKGSPAAREACRNLNYYRTDTEGNPLLGDYFLSDGCSEEYVLRIISRANTSVVNAVYNALTAGTADFGENNWAQRVFDASVREAVDTDNCGKEEDTLYREYAIEIYPALQQFTEKYENAAVRAAVNKNKSLVSPEKGDSGEIPEETLDIIEAGDKLDESDGDALFIAAHDLLNEYMYSDDLPLGDWLVSMGRLTFSGTDDLRKIYPLVCALTEGQAGILRMTGVAPLVFCLSNSEDLLEFSETYFSEIDSKVKSYAGDTCVSVWVGTNQEIYEQEVAFTDELEKYSQAGARYMDLTKADAFDEALNEIMNMLNFVSLVSTIAYCVTYLTVEAAGFFNFAIWAGTATTWTVCASAVGSGVLSSILGVLGCAAIIAGYVFMVAMLVLLVVMFVKWIIDSFADEDEQYTWIPETFYDLFGSACVKYDAVHSYALEGSPYESLIAYPDINARNGKRWNALYVTRDPAVGKPITVDEAGNAFAVSTGANITPSGYRPVSNFGENVAANMNSNVRESYAPAIFLYYHYEGGVIEQNEGEEVPETPDTKYLLKLSLVTEKSEAAAKSKLTKTDYTVLDSNLSPVTGVYTYLGYMTTTDASKAITDIRVSARNDSSPFIFGSASYTCCGKTPTGDGLYYTSYASAGSPVLSDILLTDSAAKAPAGFEPVNLFCGGGAYNFNTGDYVERNTSTSYDKWHAVKRLLYFHPSVMYTSGEELISGLVIVSGVRASDRKNAPDDYIKELGLIKMEGNLTKGLSADREISFSDGWVLKPFTRLETYICYSVTYNPCRAITDIRSYIASPSDKSIFANFGSVTNCGFAVCDIMYQMDPYPVAAHDLDEFYRGIYTNHSYTTSLGADVVDVYDRGEMAHDDFEDVSWKNSGLRAKGLFVSGPCAGKSPLRVGDVFLTTARECPDGFVSVQDARTPNATAPHNIAYDRDGSKDTEQLYLYMKKDVEEKKYIASVSVFSYDLKSLIEPEIYSKLEDEQKEEINKGADDTCIRSLLSSCSDEIINVNVAMKKRETFAGDWEKYVSNCSYIGVTRTNDASKAITGIIKYRSEPAPAEITVGGVKYTRCGDKIKDRNGTYRLYSAVSSGAVPGEPITSISLSDVPIVSGAATALNATETDSADKKASLKGATGDAYYLHTFFEDNGTYISSVYLGHGKTRSEALCNLLTQGCCIALDMDLNENTGGECIYLGYTRYSPKKTDKNAKYAVRDVIITSGEDFSPEIVSDGIRYTAAFSDQKDGLSLNSGTNGDKLYLYYTTYAVSGSDKNVLSMSPVMRFAASGRDRVPSWDGPFSWEYVARSDGERCNLNQGVISTSNDGLKMKDCRVWLYLNRMDNTVVPSRKTTGGHCDDMVEYGTAKIRI